MDNATALTAIYERLSTGYQKALIDFVTDLAIEQSMTLESDIELQHSAATQHPLRPPKTSTKDKF